MPSSGKENTHDQDDIVEIEVLESNIDLMNNLRNERTTDSSGPRRKGSETRSSSRSSSSSAPSFDDVSAHPVSGL